MVVAAALLVLLVAVATIITMMPIFAGLTYPPYKYGQEISRPSHHVKITTIGLRFSLLDVDPWEATCV